MKDIKLLVENFGPIRSGFNGVDGYISVPKFCVFCGPQGTGKSTLAKLVSTLSWYEKELFRRVYAVGRARLVSVKELFSYQGMVEYVHPNTRIIFIGEYIRFEISGGNISASLVGECKYEKPQIIYVPAERNLSSIIQKADGLQLLPLPLRDMHVEFIHAKEWLSSNYSLPANGYEFQFDKAEGRSWIVNASAGASATPISLEHASSGLQSMLPMLLVSDYLKWKVEKAAEAPSVIPDMAGKSASEVIAFQRRIDEILHPTAMKDGAECTTEDDLEKLRRYFEPNRRMINVVEEPELNLYPQTQGVVIDKLVALTNDREGNRLVMSTHSPYVVNELVLLSKAGELYSKYANRIHCGYGDIPPKGDAIRPEMVRLYELHEDGSVVELAKSHGLLSDSNLLNRELERWNERFETLMSLEEKIRG